MARPFSPEHDELRRSVRVLAGREGAVRRLSSLLDEIEGDLVAAVAVFEELASAGHIEVGSTALQERGAPPDAIALLRAALAVGGAGRAVDLAIGYGRERHTFGKPIAKHQAVRHLLAGMHVQARMGSELLYACMSSAPSYVAAHVPHLAWGVADDGLQVFGGHGYARGSEIGDLWLAIARLRAQAPATAMPPPDVSDGLLEARHGTLHSEVASFVAAHLEPNADPWDAAESFPRELFREAARVGLFGWKYPEEVGGNGIDVVADAIVTEELTFAGSGGVAASFGAHKDLGCLYLFNFGTPEQHERWLRPALTGKLVTALAVTEPEVGSDVASLTTSARRDGAEWVIRGTKTFITNGAWADVVVVAAKTDPAAGHAGITLFVVERGTPGFEARHVPMLGWRPSKTGQLSFDDVRVPEENRLGEEGGGFYAIMHNFVWERLVMALAQGASGTRLIEELWDVERRPPRLEALSVRHTAARALTYSALRSFVEGGSPLCDVAGAKWVTSETAFEAAALRHAVAPDERSERALRDLRLGPIGGGTSEIMKEVVGRVLGL